MRIETRHLHSRQIFRFNWFAVGTTWRSPSTGKELTLIENLWGKEDPILQRPLFAHEYFRGHALSLLYPELPEALGGRKFQVARRVSDDGWCRPENEVVAFAIEKERGVFSVDLVGYGPTAWLKDGISGQEILELPIDAWRASAIWSDPGRMVSIASLQRGWVIRSEQFARAAPRFAPKPDGEFRLYQDRGDEELDEARGRARFFVESIVPEEDIEWDDGPEDYSGLRIRVRRLREDGAFDPRGEVIEFHQHRHHRNATWNSPFQPVELLGQMAFDGSGFTATLPKPLAF